MDSFEELINMVCPAIGSPFIKIAAPETKFDPLTLRVKLVPAFVEVGLIEVIVGAGGAAWEIVAPSIMRVSAPRKIIFLESEKSEKVFFL